MEKLQFAIKMNHGFIWVALSQLFVCQRNNNNNNNTYLMALCSGLPWWDGTRKVKPIWILLKQETVGGSSISLAICKSAPCLRQIPTPASHHSIFYSPDAQPTASKHWREKYRCICQDFV